MNLENMVKVGKVSSVNATAKTARVIFPDLDNMVSGELSVLQHPRAGVAIKEDGEHSHAVTNEACSCAGTHVHKATVTSWMPNVGETVLCIFPAIPDSDGYVLGVM